MFCDRSANGVLCDLEGQTRDVPIDHEKMLAVSVKNPIIEASGTLIHYQESGLQVAAPFRFEAATQPTSQVLAPGLTALVRLPRCDALCSALNAMPAFKKPTRLSQSAADSALWDCMRWQDE